jgi:hypothetical protein
MSRSYKKEPVLKYAPKSNVGQKFANRRVRRYKKDLSNGMAYKRLYCQYDVHDCVSRYSLADALHYRIKSLAYDEIMGYESSEEDLKISLTINNWAKFYYRK